MPIGDGLRQDDIDYLFSLGYGELLELPMMNANRLISQDLIEPVSGLDGAKVRGMTNYNVGITPKGRCMLSAVRMKAESRFSVPGLL